MTGRVNTSTTPSACDDLGGRTGAGQVCTVHTQTTDYTIDMSFPVTYPEQPALATVLRRQRDQFVQTVSEPPVRDVPKALDPIVENELRNRLQGAPVDANPIGAHMYQNFALTDDAVIFFIGQGQWTIEAAGAQQVSVPRSALAPTLA